jgi:DMSO/TMAO reductase YedYZ molybdopterin-dependent catalytic subunit
MDTHDREGGTGLPPGQRRIDGFPRFGTHLHDPAPPVPADPSLAIAGAVAEPFALSLADLAELPRRELTADFHCVAGWSATGLRWEGVAFATFYRQVVEPKLRAGASITHVVFEGLDGYRSKVFLEDALADDVLIAERLDGEPLDADHGAPLRLVSPSQYGFVSVKHLCRVAVHTGEPGGGYHPLGWRQFGLNRLVSPHPRARVWREERHRHLPGTALRPAYRLLIPPIRWLSARGRRR